MTLQDFAKLLEASQVVTFEYITYPEFFKRAPGYFVKEVFKVSKSYDDLFRIFNRKYIFMGTFSHIRTVDMKNLLNKLSKVSYGHKFRLSSILSEYIYLIELHSTLTVVCSSFIVCGYVVESNLSIFKDSVSEMLTTFINI